MRAYPGGVVVMLLIGICFRRSAEREICFLGGVHFQALCGAGAADARRFWVAPLIWGGGVPIIEQQASVRGCESRFLGGFWMR